jgi:ATP-dependent Clp protease ATP-binding subunit ClpC
MTLESNLDPALAAKLKRMHLRLELPDQDTLALKRVPANQSRFNKARTNLLIKRSTEGMPCVVCVDEDLEYRGTDQTLTQTFASAPTQQGWRILAFSGTLHGDLAAALEYALDILDPEEQPGKQAAVPAASGKTRMLEAWSDNLTRMIADKQAGATLFRDEEMEQVAACTLSWQGGMPLVLGDAGTGKSNLLQGVARLLAQRGREILAVNMGAVMAGTLFESEREALLRALLREAHELDAVLAMEQAEWALMGVPRGLVLLREALDHGVRMIATTAPEHASRFNAHPLASRLDAVRLKELCASDTRRILEQLRPSIAAHHRVEIAAEVEHEAVERARPMEGALPGKAVKLLDAAAARASLSGSSVVSLMDIYIAASRMPEENS